MLNFKSTPTFDYSAHELANLLPMTSASEFANLKSDIAANGLLNPIWLFEGRILDGRNRYRACREINYSLVLRTFESSKATTPPPKRLCSQRTSNVVN